MKSVSTINGRAVPPGTSTPMRPMYTTLSNPHLVESQQREAQRTLGGARVAGEAQEINDEEMAEDPTFHDALFGWRYATISDKINRGNICMVIAMVLMAATFVTALLTLIFFATVWINHGGELATGLAFMVNMNSAMTGNLNHAVPLLVQQMAPTVQGNLGCSLEVVCEILTAPLATKLNITFDCASIATRIDDDCPIDFSGIVFGDDPIINGTVSASQVNSDVLHNSGSSVGFTTQVDDLNDVDASSPSSYHGRR